MTILIGFPLTHPSLLSQFLNELSDSHSPLYHHYLSQAEFDTQYGGADGPYQSAIAYFGSYGVSNLTTGADRLVITFEASSALVGTIFHTHIDTFSYHGRVYYGPTGPVSLPGPLAHAISVVEGFSSYSQYLYHPLGGITHTTIRAPLEGYPSPSASLSGYPQPLTDAYGNQYDFGSDFQVGYDELSLFNDSGFPTNMVVATILASGCAVVPSGNSPCPSNDLTAPFYPKDIYDYYNETIPTGQPHSSVFGVGLYGAPPPGPSAQYDQLSDNGENTLDLEMIGSTAPGSSIYNVYGPGYSPSYQDGAFSYILNPTNTPALQHVSVISNSWGGQDQNDSVWYTDLQEAQGRGISVLASSGDGGDNPSSSKWQGSIASFPASMSYNAFGMTSVGGTTVTLDANPSSPNYLHIDQQIAWYISAADASDGGPAGSQGGLSLIFPEPSWQQTTSANAVIQAAAQQLSINPGRGLPDVGVIGNNTLVTLSISGTQYVDDPFWGTSIGSPLEAGIVAEMDHVLEAHSNPVLGFLNPNLYALASYEDAPLVNSTDYVTGYDVTGSYISALPTLPLLDVEQGANYYYAAARGYDLVTGWGSIDAYNYTMYFLTLDSTGVNGRLSGVEDQLTLSNLAVTSTGCYGGPCSFNASIQQNFFLANSLGAPVYWVQNVIYVTSAPGGWAMNYTGWVIFPFYGLYYYESIYEYNFPSSGTLVSLPSTFDVKSLLETNGYLDGQYIAFSVGSHIVDLPVPGAAYIIGSLTYQYSWQGVTYTNGPFPDNPTPGGLSPQFGMVGGPSGGTADFVTPTAGSLTATIQPYGQAAFVAASTSVFGGNIDQTAEAASNLQWTQQSTNQWSLGISQGSTQQGVLSYEAAGASSYSVTFTESGLPSGTSWSVTLNGATEMSTTNSVSYTEANGTYSYSVGSIAGYTASPPSGSLTVAGAAVMQPITFAAQPPPMYAVFFAEVGLASGTSWSVVLSGVMSSTTGSSITFSEANGSYSFTIAAVSGYTASPTAGTVTVSGGEVTETITFTAAPPETYAVTFTETGLPGGTSWSVTLNGGTAGSSGSTITFAELNGTYSYTVAATSGYSPSPNSGSVSVQGGAQDLAITFTSTGGGTGGGSGGILGLPGSTGYYVLGGILAVVVIAVALALAMRSRRSGAMRPPPGPPPGAPFPGASGPGPTSPVMPFPPAGGPGATAPPRYVPAPSIEPIEPRTPFGSAPPAAASQGPSPPTRAKFCGACGRPYSDNERFCANCGSPRGA